MRVPSIQTIKAALGEMRRFHVLAKEAGRLPSDDFVRVAKWLKSRSESSMSTMEVDSTTTLDEARERLLEQLDKGLRSPSTGRVEGRVAD